jgi:hypothetical protein
MDAAADSYEIHVSANHGVVTLRGSVESWEAGADSVHNELEVELAGGTTWLPHYF